MDQPINVIFILGMGHSGTTLTDIILGSHSQITSMGAMESYERFFAAAEKERCTCGKRIIDCEFWIEVQRQIEAGGERWPVDLKAKSISFEKNVSTFLRTVLNVSGKSWICDSSKNGARLERYQSSACFNVFTVYVIRDPRAVAFSWQKHYGLVNFFRMLGKARQQFRRKVSGIKSMPHHYILRYEDLVSDPEKEMRELVGRIGLRFEQRQLQFWEAQRHIFAGNGMMRRGDREIGHDIGYLEGIGFLRWLLSTLLCADLLISMKYPLSKRGVRSMSSRQFSGQPYQPTSDTRRLAEVRGQMR